MADNEKIVLGVAVDASAVKPALDGVARDAGAMAQKVAAAGKDAGSGVEQIGASAGKSAQQTKRELKSITDQIQRVQIDLATAGKSASEALQIKADIKGIDISTLKPQLEALRALEAAQHGVSGSMQKTGMSAGAMTAAMRNVPAQMTDIVVSLQGGQKPLTVLLQQGGQLKDMFGGIGPAAKALGGYVLGMVNPLTVAAAGMGAFALAMSSANSKLAESNGIAVQLAATGRSADMTREQFSALTKELTLLPGVSKDAAKAILGEFVKTREIGGALFRELGMSVADFAAATGVTAPEAAKTLAKAFADPAKGAKDLEAALGSLTSEQMLTIEAMQKVGDKAGAQRVLMDALKDSVKGLANDAMTPLGREVDSLGNAWSMMLAKVGNSSGLNTANNIFASLIGNVAALVRKLSELKLPPWLQSSFSGGLNGMVFDALGGKGGGRGATGSWGTPQTGATGSWAPPANAVDDQVKNVLELTKSYKSQAGAMGDVRQQGDLVRESLAALRKEGKGNSIQAKELEDRLAGVNEKLKSMGKSGAASASSAARAANRELESQAKLMADLSGLSVTFSKDWDRLNLQYKAGKINVDQLTQAQAALLAKQPAMKAAAIEQAKAQKEFSDVGMRQYLAELKRVEAIEKTLSSMTDQNQKLKEEIEMLGLSEQAQLAITQARLSSAVALKEEQVARLQNSEFLSREQIALEEEIRLLKERQGLLGQKSQRSVAVEQAKAADAEWKKTATSIENTLTDSLMRAFEGGKGFGRALRDTVVNMFKTMVLRPVISAVMSPVSSAIGSVLGMPGASNVAAGTDLFGMASNASSLYSSASSLVSMGSQVFAGTMSVANALGTVAANATGTGLSGLLAANGAYGTAAAGSATALAGTATAAMAAIPVWGWAALGAAAIGSLFGGKKDSRFGSQYQYTPGSGSAVVGGPNAGVDFGGMSAASNAAAAGIDDLLTKLGSLSRVGSLSSGFESSEKGKGFSYAGGVLSTGQVFGQGANGRGYENNRGSMTVEQAHASYIQELKQSTLQALQAATDIPKSVEDLLKGVNIDGLTNAALDQLMATVGAQVTQLANFKAALDLLPFTQLQGMSIKALDALSALTGGLDALGTKLGGYYENFYGAEEKRANMVRNITKTLKDAGGAWTEADVAGASREAFRKLVESTDTGSPLYAALINVSDAFASITPAIESAADMAKAAIEAALEQVKVARSNLIDAYKAEATAMQSTVDKFRNFATDLRSFRDGLTLGALSPLTPAQRYAQASGQFNNTVAATKSGSEAERIAAIGNLQGASTALLEASKVYNSSSGAYVMDFNRVQSALADAAINALATADVAQLQLDAAKSQLTALGEIDKSVMSVSSAIEALAAAQMAAITAGALPAFENGGTHGSARAMAAERGPELAYMPPVSIYTATDTGRVMGGQSASNDALLAEVKAMREESKQLREEIKQLRQQQSQETGALIQSHYDANAKNAEFITTHQSKKSWSTEPALS